MDSHEELAFLPAVDIAAQIRARTLSPLEVVDAFLARIETSAAAYVNAFTVVLAERARAAAREAERATGPATGPLHGVPFAIKDLTPTAGVTTSYGSLAFKGHVPAENAPLVDRMLAAGGILLGKTTTPEFGNKGTTESRLSGTTRNPWCLSHTAGGSSGGSAAAVAAGLVPIAQGSDGGGSIRIPAALCGVVGLKPSFGRVPFLPEDSVFETMTHVGPLARTVADAALMLSVIAGPDERDPFSLADRPDYLTAAETWRPIHGRVGYSSNLGLGPVDSEVERATREAAETLARELGATFVELDVALPDPEPEMLVIWSTALGYVAEDLILPRAAEEDVDPAILELRDRAKTLSAIDYYRSAVVFKDELYRAVKGIFDHHDLLITPVTATPAFPHPDWHPGPAQVAGIPVDRRIGWLFTYPFNMTGHPALALPCGFSDDDLPIGLQIVGPRHADAAVLAAGMRYEAATSWKDRHPTLTEALDV